MRIEDTSNQTEEICVDNIRKFKYDKMTKEAFYELPLAQKWQYFQDYYLLKVVAAVFMIVFASYVFYVTFIHHTEQAISIAVMNDSSYSMQASEFEQTLHDMLGLDESQTVDVGYYDPDDAESNMGLIAKMGAGVMDLVITDHKTYEQYASSGTFLDLKEYLPENMQQQLAGRFLETQVQDTDWDGNVLSTEAAAVYGIDISGFSALKDAGSGFEDPVIGVLKISMNKDNVLKTIQCLTDGTAVYEQ